MIGKKMFVALVAFSMMSALPMAAADGPTGDSRCNNNGIVVQAGVQNEYHCDASMRYCDQGTGAGAGAGAGGQAQNMDAGAEAAASGNCDNSGAQDAEQCVEGSAGNQCAPSGTRAASIITDKVEGP